MTNLPPGWVTTTIGTVTADAEQRQPDAKDSFYYIDISSINRETKSISNPEQIEGQNAPSRARKIVKATDVLVSMTRPNLNAVAMVPATLQGQIASTGFEVLRAIEIDPRWLFYYVRSDSFISAMTSLVQGALYPAIRPKDIRNFEIPLAPYNEQKCIADKLDSLLERVDVCRNRLAAISTLLKRFRQSLLSAAASGTLTSNFSQSKRNWTKVALGSLLSNLRYGTSKKCTSDSSGCTVLRIPNIGDTEIVLDDLKYGHFTDSERENYALQVNDLLIIRSNGSPQLVGRCTLVPESCTDFLFAGYLIRLRVDQSKIDPRYLALYLRSPSVRAYIDLTARSTSGVHNINSEEVKAIQIDLPPLAEQQEIVQYTEALLVFTDNIEGQITNASTQLRNLTAALLAKAFRGELLPQDPNDEPASVLLEHVSSSSTHLSKEIEKRRRSTAKIQSDLVMT